MPIRARITKFSRYWAAPERDVVDGGGALDLARHERAQTPEAAGLSLRAGELLGEMFDPDHGDAPH